MKQIYFERYRLTIWDKLAYLGIVLLIGHICIEAMALSGNIAEKLIFDIGGAYVYESTIMDLFYRLPVFAFSVILALYFIALLFKKRPPVFKREKEKTLFGRTPLLSADFIRNAISAVKNPLNRKSVILKGVTVLLALAMFAGLTYLGVTGYYERTELSPEGIVKYDKTNTVTETIPYNEVESWKLYAFWDYESALNGFEGEGFKEAFEYAVAESQKEKKEEEITMTLTLKDGETLEFDLMMAFCDNLEKAKELEAKLAHASKKVEDERLSSVMSLYDIEGERAEAINELFDKLNPEDYFSFEDDSEYEETENYDFGLGY